MTNGKNLTKKYTRYDQMINIFYIGRFNVHYSFVKGAAVMKKKWVLD